jgi:diphosphomevalonate decarboxylase
MNLNKLSTTTTVEFSGKQKKDEVIINGVQNEEESSRVIKHLDRIRNLAHICAKAKVVSENNFPTATGLSSSASGFAALTVAGSAAAGLPLDTKGLSILARQGSGSACRSIPDGFVEWLDGDASARSIFPADHWDIIDVVAVVSAQRKDVSTSEGQKLVETSPFMMTRLSRMSGKITQCKKYIKEKDFRSFGELIESEALELHAIMLTSRPSLIYWLPATIQVMKLVKKWRSEGLPVYFTVNTGQDVHLICEKKHTATLEKKLKTVPEIKRIIINNPSRGTALTNKHLF